MTALKRFGGRMTQARRLVIEALDQAERPLLAKDIYALACLRAQGVSLDLASVYRTLDRLIELELIHQIGSSGAYFPCRHWECKKGHHILVSCRNCPRVDEVEVPQSLLQPLFEHLKQTAEKFSKRHTIQMEGECGHCSPA